MSNRSFFALFKRVMKRAIALFCFFALFERAKEQSLFLKERKSKNEQKMSYFPNNRIIIFLL